MLDKLFKKLTNNYNEVPLFWVDFNLNHYQENGVENSCIAKIHPELKNDQHVKATINGLINHIRNNYDMTKLCK